MGRMLVGRNIDEILLGEKRSENDIKKFNRRYYIMIGVVSLALYLSNEIWHFNNEMTWWHSVIGGFLITTGFYGYLLLYKKFLLSKHKFLFIIGFVLIALFKLLPYILGWKKF
jgi:uncharacterized membrane protein